MSYSYGTLALAPLVSLSPGDAGSATGTVEGLRCTSGDVDHVRFALPALEGASVSLAFAPEQGSLRLVLLDEQGQELPNGVADAAMAASGSAFVHVPGRAGTSRTIVTRVDLSDPSFASDGQPWTLTISTADESQCGGSEPQRA